jgi:antitoxin HicB
MAINLMVLLILFEVLYYVIMQRTYKILLHKEPEGTFTVSVPALPGCMTYGDTVEHAIEMAKEAIELYIAELQDRGDYVPDDSETLEYSLSLQTE